MTHTLCSAENWRPPWLIQPTVLDALQGAIEQLQEELAGARQEVEKWRRVRQGGARQGRSVCVRVACGPRLLVFLGKGRQAPHGRHPMACRPQ